MAVPAIGEVGFPYETMWDWSFGFSGCFWSHLQPPAVCLMNPSASMQGNGFKYGVVSLWPLLLGLMSMGAKECSRRGCVLKGRHGLRCQDTAHTEDTQVYKIRQMKEYCYSNTWQVGNYISRCRICLQSCDCPFTWRPEILSVVLKTDNEFSLQCYAHILSLLTTVPSNHQGMKTEHLPDPFLRSNEQTTGYGSPLTGSGDALGACPA